MRKLLTSTSANVKPTAKPARVIAAKPNGKPAKLSGKPAAIVASDKPTAADIAKLRSIEAAVGHTPAPAATDQHARDHLSYSGPSPVLHQTGGKHKPIRLLTSAADATARDLDYYRAMRALYGRGIYYRYNGDALVISKAIARGHISLPDGASANLGDRMLRLQLTESGYAYAAPVKPAGAKA